MTTRVTAVTACIGAVGTTEAIAAVRIWEHVIGVFAGLSINHRVQVVRARARRAASVHCAQVGTLATAVCTAQTVRIKYGRCRDTNVKHAALMMTVHRDTCVTKAI